MTRATLADRSARGYFGKVPGVADFIFHGLPAQVCEVWGDHMAGWVAAGSSACGNEWPARFASSPVWRFVLSGGVIGDAAWIGLLAGSIDSVGRAFPFSVMVAVDPAIAGQEAVPALDPLFDALEESMLAFIEGGDADGRLAVALDDLASRVEHESFGRGAPRKGDGFLYPRSDEVAVLATQRAERSHGSLAQAVYSLPGRAGRTSAISVWWHRDPRDGLSEICVSRGIPAGDGALPFFLGDWEHHGWQQRSDRPERAPLP